MPVPVWGVAEGEVGSIGCGSMDELWSPLSEVGGNAIRLRHHVVELRREFLSNAQDGTIF